jgi:hypothetical protein
MTLIVGVHAGDHLFLAADSGVTHGSGTVTQQPKLSLAGQFAWGFSGQDDLGLQFSAWMLEHHARLSKRGNWNLAIEEIGTASNRLNAGRRSRMAEAGIDLNGPLQWNDFVHVMVAGVFGDQCGIFTVDWRGSAERVVPESIITLGVDGGAHAAYDYFKRYARWKPNQDRLEELMDLAISFSQPDENLRSPWRVLRIDPNGVTDISNDEFRRRFPELFRTSNARGKRSMT